MSVLERPISKPIDSEVIDTQVKQIRYGQVLWSNLDCSEQNKILKHLPDLPPQLLQLPRELLAIANPDRESWEIDQYRYVIGPMFSERGKKLRSLFTGYDLKTYRPVAVKLLSHQNEEVRSRLDLQSPADLEARVQDRLSPWHAVRVWDYHKLGGNPYLWKTNFDTALIMPLLDHKSRPTLERYIYNQGKLKPQECAWILSQLAETVDYLAQVENLTHNDLKPENMIVNQDLKSISLIDMGLAGNLVKQFGEGRVAGTNAYTSPERLQGFGEDLRSEVYAIALIGYEMLTGKVYYDSSSFSSFNTLDFLLHICSSDGIQPKQKRTLRFRRLSRFISIFDTALKNDPDERYQTATEFARAFSEVARGR